MTSRPASSTSSSSTYSSFKSWLSLAAGAVLLGLGGCASVKQAPAGEDASAKRFEAPAGLSRIYIYRNEFLGTLVGLDLSVDGQVAGTTKGKTFVIADVPPGDHEIVSKGENTHQLRISTQIGQPSFVWQEVKMGLLSAGSRLHAVDAATGRAGVNESSLVDSPLMRGGAGAVAAPATTPAPAPAAAATPSEKSAAAVPVAAPAPAPAPVTMPAASPAPAQAAAPVSAPVVQKAVPVAAQPLAPASKLAPSRYEFEAERVAMERGCRGAGGVRPSARLVAREGHVESFEMSCAPLRVRCDTGMCRVMD
ncbi:DUF2846 domain-containing protein [Paucibacter sp. DJ2R-2]|uniref:DUF2846 domain-containing protein n=1 Tax=Paucibacter sp. DJ2R-2 TaxID=2893558 RepID=UPI0021E45011|nr:DUF2846 domain-containing protein [Paucibacter sp. DJ2R-2]MCV2420115.1 DUF2846 domain-containing protein [Paucibacter sp. DJ4R-1]MCV2436958.1 DUF2846 domain-containing protein [Paucibacter sp. DJ2R-2]